jgi:hypothetical protein
LKAAPSPVPPEGFPFPSGFHRFPSSSAPAFSPARPLARMPGQVRVTSVDSQLRQSLQVAFVSTLPFWTLGGLPAILSFENEVLSFRYSNRLNLLRWLSPHARHLQIPQPRSPLILTPEILSLATLLQAPLPGVAAFEVVALPRRSFEFTVKVVTLSSLPQSRVNPTLLSTPYTILLKRFHRHFLRFPSYPP